MIPNKTTVMAQPIATIHVMRVRLRSPTAEDCTPEAKPPPNISVIPPPRPRCTSTSPIMTRLVTTSSTHRVFSRISTTLPSPLDQTPTRIRDDTRMGNRLKAHLVRTEAYDLRKLLRIEARATDQTAVNIGLCHELRDGTGLDRTAVQDAHAGS